MNRYSNVSKALNSWGWSVGYVSGLLRQAATYGFAWTVGKFAGIVSVISSAVFSPLGGVIAVVGIAAGIWYLSNNRVFY